MLKIISIKMNKEEFIKKVLDWDVEKINSFLNEFGRGIKTSGKTAELEEDAYAQLNFIWEENSEEKILAVLNKFKTSI
jgi:hypothetical protein